MAMLKIVSRPPFDDFSMNLFFSLYARKRQYGLDKATFLYMWTGPISFSSGVYINHSKVSDPRRNLMLTTYFTMSTNSLKISGDKRFFNEKQDMFIDFLTTCGIHDLTEEEENELREDFNRLYDEYSANTFSVIETEKLVADTIEGSTSEVIVLFIKDHFRMSIKDSWTESVPEFSKYFANMCDFYSDKKFVIVTSLENLDKEIQRDNCTIVNMGGDVTNQLSSYMEFTPEVRKEKVKNYISLNRGPRYHRMYLLANLYAREIDGYGQLSFLSIPRHDTELDDVIEYDHGNDTDYDKINRGFKRYLSSSHQLNEDYYDIYPNKGNDNLTNFKNALQHKYVKSYVEFITETSYNEKSFNITEKTLHFIYGCNYPIMISSPGTVKFLRSIGVDMFDDVIDHSYDDIEDPTERIKQAIDLNIGILTLDLDALNKLWERDKYRMEQNISFAQTKLAEFYKNRFWEQIKGLQL